MSKDYYQDEEIGIEEAQEEFDTDEGFEDTEDIYEEEFYEDGEFETSEPAKSHRGLKIAAGILVVIALAIGGVMYGFQLQEVRVIGNKNYTEEEIKSLMGFPEDAPNTLLSYFRYMRFKVKDVPFINGIRVKMEGRNMLCIEVSEKDILGSLKKGKTYYYFDNEGIVQESLSEKKKTVPIITGVKAENLEVGAEIQIKDKTIRTGILELTQLLLKHGIQSQEIDIDKGGYFTIYIDDNIRVAMGIPVMLEEKTTELANILPELRKMEESEQIQGVLHLENYDFTKNSIIFTKEN